MSALKRIGRHFVARKSFYCNNIVHTNIFYSSYYHFCAEKNDKNKNDDDNFEKKQEKSNLFSEIEKSWRNAKEQINKHQEEQQQHNNHNDDDDDDKQEWINKYDLIRSENKFDLQSCIPLDFKFKWEYFSMVYIRNPLYKFAMNSGITSFSDRFLYYEEFMCGVMDGFSFISQCLGDNQFEEVKDCFDPSVFAHIHQLKTTILNDGFVLNKFNVYIYNVRIDKHRMKLNEILQQQQQQRQQTEQSNADIKNVNVYKNIEMFFDVKYYCQFVNDNGEYEYKIIDILWYAQYEPIEGEKVKCQINKPWHINHVTVSLISQT